MRLDKWLSDATSYTRSQLKQLIRSGQVTVNQTIVKKTRNARSGNRCHLFTGKAR